MAIDHIKNQCRVLCRAGIPTFITGAHGIGKTTAIYQLYQEMAAEFGARAASLEVVQEQLVRSKVIDPDEVIVETDLRHLSSLDGKHLAREAGRDGEFRFWSMSAPNVSIEELIGMPHVTDYGARFQEAYLRSWDVASRVGSDVDAIEEVRKVVFDRMCRDLGLSPEDRGRVTVEYLRLYGLMPEPGHKGGGIWIIDEANRGFEEVEKALMQIMLEKRYLDYELPDNVWIVTTMNPPGGEYRVRELDPATLDRGALLSVRSDTDEFLEWAKKRGLGANTRRVADKHRKLLNAHEDEMNIELNVTPTSRSMEFMDRAWAAMSEDEIKAVGPSLCKSLLGGELGNFYYKMSTEKIHEPLKVEEVVKKYGFKPKGKPEMLKDMNAYDKIKVTKTRARLKAMVKDTNVKSELIKQTMDEIKDWVASLDAELRTRSANRKDDRMTEEERCGTANIALFLYDVPADMARDFLVVQLKGIYELPFYWIGASNLLDDIFKRVKTEYDRAEKDSKS